MENVPCASRGTLLGVRAIFVVVVAAVTVSSSLQPSVFKALKIKENDIQRNEEEEEQEEWEDEKTIIMRRRRRRKSGRMRRR